MCLEAARPHMGEEGAQLVRVVHADGEGEDALRTWGDMGRCGEMWGDVGPAPSP